MEFKGDFGDHLELEDQWVNRLDLGLPCVQINPWLRILRIKTALIQAEAASAESDTI